MDSFDLIVLKSEGPVPQRAQLMVDAIGRLMMNCGLLENLCKSGIFDLEQDEAKRIRICNLPWGKRSGSLIKLIQKHVSEQGLQMQIIQVIEKIKILMMNSRNPISHGLVIHKKEEILIVDSKLRKNSENGQLEATRKSIRLSEIKQRIDESADLVDEWKDLWERIQNKKRTP